MCKENELSDSLKKTLETIKEYINVDLNDQNLYYSMNSSNIKSNDNSYLIEKIHKSKRVQDLKIGERKSEFYFVIENKTYCVLVEELNDLVKSTLRVYHQDTMLEYYMENYKMIYMKESQYNALDHLSQKLIHLRDKHNIADNWSLSQNLITTVFPYMHSVTRNDKNNLRDSNLKIMYEYIVDNATINDVEIVSNILNDRMGKLTYEGVINDGSSFLLSNVSGEVISIYYDNENISVFNDMKHLIAYDELDSYFLFETNGGKTVVFFLKKTGSHLYLDTINEYLFNHIKDAKLLTTSTIYKNDQYGGIYFEFIKCNDHIGVFAYCDKRSRNIYHISCYKKNDKTVEIYSISAQRDYKDVVPLSTLKTTITYIDNVPSIFLSEYQKSNPIPLV